MATVYFSPVGNGQTFFNSSGLALAGGQIFTYIAGTTTPIATYTDNTGTVQNANPIILNSAGQLSSEIWITQSVKFLVKDSLGVTIQTIDNIPAINNVSNTATEWVASGLTPTFISSTSFSVSGDQTLILTKYRRVKILVTAGTVYGYILTSTFGSGITTIVVLLDSGVLDSGITTVSYGFADPTNPSLYSNSTTYYSVVMSANSGTLVISDKSTNMVDISGILTNTGNITTTFPQHSALVVFDNAATGVFPMTLNSGAYTLPMNKSLWYWNGTTFELVTQFEPGLPDLTVTQAAGALTISVQEQPLYFRSATLTTGTPSSIVAAASSLTLPSGGTLGVTTTLSGRIVIALMNNGGVAEIAIANISGGLQMDETNLISTTAVGAGSTANNVWYSTTARSNLPYRVIGFADVVNTAGAWSNPTLVQGNGGNNKITSGSMVRLNTANGYGSTNTKIRRFTNVVTNQGSDITYADSATLGASFTINTNGMYVISYSDQFANAGTVGVSLNTTSPTTSVVSITITEILTISTTSAANFSSNASCPIYLTAGSVVRPHTDGSVTGTTTTECQFIISKVD